MEYAPTVLRLLDVVYNKLSAGVSSVPSNKKGRILNPPLQFVVDTNIVDCCCVTLLVVCFSF